MILKLFLLNIIPHVDFFSGTTNGVSYNLSCMPVRKVIELAAGAQIRAIDCKRISLISGFLIPGIHCSKKKLCQWSIERSSWINSRHHRTSPAFILQVQKVVVICPRSHSLGDILSLSVYNYGELLPPLPEKPSSDRIMHHFARFCQILAYFVKLQPC